MNSFCIALVIVLLTPCALAQPYMGLNAGYDLWYGTPASLEVGYFDLSRLETDPVDTQPKLGVRAKLGLYDLNRFNITADVLFGDENSANGPSFYAFSGLDFAGPTADDTRIYQPIPFHYGALIHFPITERVRLSSEAEIGFLNAGFSFGLAYVFD